MNNLILTNALTMSSKDLLDVINEVRKAENEKPIRANDFHARVADELSDFNYETFVVQNLNKTESTIFKLTQDMCMLVAMRESKKVRRIVLEKLKGQFSQTNTIFLPNFNNPAEAARAWADEVEKNQRLLVTTHEQTKKIESLESLFKHGESVTQFCKKLNGVNVMDVSKFLEKKNWLYNESKSGVRWRVKSYARDKYMTEEVTEITPHGLEPFIINKPVLLKAGAVKLYNMYLKNELPMKKTWNGEYTQDKELKGAA